MCATSLCGLCAVVQDLSEMRARGDFAGLKTVQPAGTTPMTTPAAAPAPAPVAAAPVAAAAPAPEPTPAPAAAEAPAAATDAPAS